MTNQQTLKANTFENKYAFMVYLLSPLLSLFLVFKNCRAAWAKNIVWAFTVFFGFTFYIASDSTSDAVRYRETLVKMSQSDLSFDSLVDLFTSEDSQYVDIAQPVITFVVSRFTEDFRVLFAVFAFFFGYFYSRNIWYLIDRMKMKMGYISILLILQFAFIVSIASINGLRFWTATHVFFYGMMPFLVEGKKKSLWICASAIFVHFSFFLPFALLLGYLVAGNRLMLYYGLFILSFCLSEINTSGIKQATQYLPGAIQKKSDHYLQDEYAEGQQEEQANRSWFIGASRKGVAYVVLVIASVIFFYRNKFLETDGLYNVFCAGLLFYGVFNILSVIPSMGRFLSLSQMLLVSVIFWVSVAYNDKVLKRWLFVMMPFMLLFLILQVRILFGYCSYLLFIANPLTAAFLRPDKSLFEFLGGLL